MRGQGKAATAKALKAEALSTVVFIASDGAGARKTFVDVDKLEAWIFGWDGVCVDVVSHDSGDCGSLSLASA